MSEKPLHVQDVPLHVHPQGDGVEWWAHTVEQCGCSSGWITVEAAGGATPLEAVCRLILRLKDAGKLDNGGLKV